MVARRREFRVLRRVLRVPREPRKNRALRQRRALHAVVLLLFLFPGLNAFSGSSNAFNKLNSQQYSQAVVAFERGDFATATRIFTKLAENGQVESRTSLALMYDKGLGVPQNYQKAVSLFRQAAEQSDPIAQYHLGVKYVNGHGVEKSPLDAYIWFTISFNNGYEPAADPLRVLNYSLSTVDRQNALNVVVKKMQSLGK